MKNIKKKPIALTNLIYAVLGLVFLNHRQEITRILRENVYSILKTLAEQYPKYFPNVYFTKHGNLIHSNEIEDALFRLAGVITAGDFMYKYLRFNEDSLVKIKQTLKKKNWFSEEDRKIVEKLAEEFYQELKLKCF